MNESPPTEPNLLNLLTLILSNQAKLMAMGNAVAFQLARMESGITGADLSECIEAMETLYQQEIVKCRRAIFEETDGMSAPPRRNEN